MPFTGWCVHVTKQALCLTGVIRKAMLPSCTSHKSDHLALQVPVVLEMSDKGFWSRIFGGSPNDEMPTHSFEELQRIHNVLLDPANQVVNAFNKSTLIETLRELAELLIWGDQNDARVFEYFLEHNMLKHYKRILAVPSHRRGDVAVQLLQVCAEVQDKCDCSRCCNSFCITSGAPHLLGALPSFIIHELC